MLTCLGKRARLGRIMQPASGRATILALDHGLTMGPMPGLERLGERLQGAGRETADAIVLHQGMVGRFMHLFDGADRPGLIVHLSGATRLSPDASEKQLVCSVEHALRLGADGVSVHVNLGVAAENQMLADVASVSETCQRWGLPLLAMMYPRREPHTDKLEPDHVAHAVRLAMELGVDIVKVPYTGGQDSFARALQDTDIPVLVAGGAPLETEEAILGFVAVVLEAGAHGVTFGRSIFQSKSPLRMARAVAAMVHARLSPEEALALLREEPFSDVRSLGGPRAVNLAGGRAELGLRAETSGASR